MKVDSRSLINLVVHWFMHKVILLSLQKRWIALQIKGQETAQSHYIYGLYNEPWAASSSLLSPIVKYLTSYQRLLGSLSA